LQRVGRAALWTIAVSILSGCALPSIGAPAGSRRGLTRPSRSSNSRTAPLPPGVGQPAPDFVLPTRTGQPIRLSFLRSRPAILCFFCHCGLCRAVATEMAQTAELRARAQIVVVTGDANALEQEFGRQIGLDALFLQDAPPVVAPRYASETCPRCWLIDKHGIARYVNVDRLIPAKKLVAGLLAALAGSGGFTPGYASGAPSGRSAPKGQRTLAGGETPGGGAPAHSPAGRGGKSPGASAAAASASRSGGRGADRPGRYQRAVPRTLVLTPIPAGRGTILADVRTFGITLVANRKPVTIESRDGRASVATGRYDLLEWWAEVRDGEGRLWRARGGMRPFALTVTPDATSSLSLVSPLQARLVNYGRAPEIEFDLLFQGSGVDTCRGVTVDGREAPRPHIEVRDAAGRVVADLECSYCCGFKATALWRPPADLRGVLTAFPRVDFGPFHVVAEPLRLTLDAVGMGQ
jgi:peroxiredoxin